MDFPVSFIRDFLFCGIMRVLCRLIMTLMLLGFLPHGGNSQNLMRIDSLRKLLPETTGVLRFEALNALGFEYRLSHPDSTIFYCTMAYELGQALQLPKELSKPLSFIGLANAYKGDYKTSFRYHTQSIEVATEQKDSVQLGYAYNNFGRLFFDQGDISRAFTNLIKATEIFERLDDKVGKAYTYRSLSNLYKSQQDYTNALIMASKACELRKQLNDPRALLSALMELGSVYNAMKDSIEANQSFRQADSIASTINDRISQAEIQLSWAEFLLSQRDTARAHILAHQAYSTISRSANQRLLPKASLMMGIAHYEILDFPVAREYFDQVIDATEDRYLDLKRDAYFYLSKINDRDGKHNEATTAFNQYLILKESLQNIELVRQIEQLRFQLEIERIERENEILKNTQSQNDATIIQQRLQNLILVVTVVFITLMFFMQWRNTIKRKLANASLANQNQEIERQRKEISEKNAELEKHNLELSDINNEKDTLMNIVAHDLKSPLNRIKGLSELLALEGSMNPNQEKYLHLLRHSTQAGLDLINDLLEVNSLEVNREPAFSYFQLGTVVLERVQAYQHHAASKSITFQTDIAFNDLVFLDQSYITRILDNLISNAVKFSPPASCIRVGTSLHSTAYSFFVRDEGPGFQPEDLKYIFQKFRKLSARPTAGESSNGLGLAIVKILIDRLGGRIDLQTAPGKGSTFTVEFPVSNTIHTV
jgi:signal transduction histidine kinase